MESRASNKRERIDKLLNMANGNSTVPTLEIFQANDTTSIQSRFTKDIGKLPPITKELHQEDNDVGNQSMEEGINSSDNEKGQVLQTAKVVMNMLDATIPDTLTDDQKKEVMLTLVSFKFKLILMYHVNTIFSASLQRVFIEALS